MSGVGKVKAPQPVKGYAVACEIKGRLYIVPTTFRQLKREAAKELANAPASWRVIPCTITPGHGEGGG